MGGDGPAEPRPRRQRGGVAQASAARCSRERPRAAGARSALGGEAAAAGGGAGGWPPGAGRTTLPAPRRRGGGGPGPAVRLRAAELAAAASLVSPSRRRFVGRRRRRGGRWQPEPRLGPAAEPGSGSCSPCRPAPAPPLRRGPGQARSRRAGWRPRGPARPRARCPRSPPRRLRAEEACPEPPPWPAAPGAGGRASTALVWVGKGLVCGARLLAACDSGMRGCKGNRTNRPSAQEQRG